MAGAKATLQTAIDNAQAAHDAATEGSNVGEYEAGSKETLQTAIDAAQAAHDAEDANLESITAVNTALEQAVSAFEAGKVTE